jgi:hemerythrin
MALFEWQEIYSVGVERLDNQHKNLFSIANRFHAAYERGESRGVLAAIFNEMMEYTAQHFADEERMMRECNYADYDRHKAHHEKLVNLVLGYKRQFDIEQPGVEMAAMNFIKTWLTGHVLGMDRNYRDAMRPLAGRPAVQAARL